MTAKTPVKPPKSESRASKDLTEGTVETGWTGSGFAYFWAALMIVTFAISLFFMFRAALQM